MGGKRTGMERERVAGRRVSRPTRLTVAAVVVALALATAALVGCGGTTESPGGPSGTGAPAALATQTVPANVRGMVLTQLQGMGVGFNAGSASVTYVGDQAHVKVLGTFKAHADLATSAKRGAITTFAEIDMAQSGTSWVVTKAIK